MVIYIQEADHVLESAYALPDTKAASMANNGWKISESVTCSTSMWPENSAQIAFSTFTSADKRQRTRAGTARKDDIASKITSIIGVSCKLLT